MYGLIGSFTAQPGRADELVAIMLDSSGDMPGCHSYVIARDPADPDRLWITEIWDSKEAHAASLSLPAVKAAIARAMPLIASFGMHQETIPVTSDRIAS